MGTPASCPVFALLNPVKLLLAAALMIRKMAAIKLSVALIARLAHARAVLSPLRMRTKTV